MYSAPVQIKQIGLEIDDYVAMAHNVKRMISIGGEARERILDEANSELSAEVTKIATELPREMMYDREFFEEAELSYGDGIPVQGCFTTSVADYLLRNRGRLHVDSI
jgi:hypothetical protein|tara:strand:+ start:1417 stop:1737 length:321 start_codon:yes stop_codon:yes gene_type:complete